MNDISWSLRTQNIRELYTVKFEIPQYIYELYTVKFETSKYIELKIYVNYIL